MIKICWSLLFICFLASTATAQYTKLFDFGSKGSYPDGSLISDGTFLYGMTSSGGTNDFGTIFKIKPDGTTYIKLLDFDGTTNGSYPYGSLISDGTFLYGMTYGGGTNDLGTIFKIQPDGTGYVKLIDFDGTINGSYPNGDLFSDGTFLYGMTSGGGTNDFGTIFKLKPDGTGFITLLEFNGSANGSNPYGSLISDGTFLYGMTNSGGPDNFGTLFKILPNGTGYSKLHDFDGTYNGSYPSGSLFSDGSTLYGMTSSGGANGDGVLFKIMPDGTGFSILLDFNGSFHGSNPYGSLISDGTFLYGMTNYYGNNDYGTIFKILPDGSNFETLLDFDGTATGSSPYGSLISDGVFLYGLTDRGGSSDLGTVFKIKPDGTSFAKLFDFDATGITPSGSLISDGTYLYGMTPSGGTGCDAGTIFKIHEDGTGYTTIYNFGDCYSNLNGSNPHGSLLFDGTFLYGMTTTGGNFNEGIIFKILPDGTGFDVIYEFVASSAASGSNPEGSLIIDGTYLYGMTRFGDNTYTVFKILKDGTNFQIIQSEPDSQYETFGDLLYDGTFLYGMTFNGGTNNLGNIFRVKPDGSGFSNLFDFDGTNGLNPQGSLISDGTFLYGMTGANGSGFYPYSDGTIFKIMPDGTGFTKLHEFPFSDGNVTNGNLTYDGTFLYGMSTYGGANNQGSIFRINPDGTNYVELVDFDGVKGITPVASLLLKGTSLFGMTPRGGQNDLGTVFLVSLNTSSINITQQPADVGVCLGQTATLTTAASGLAIYYKWQKFNGSIFVDIDDIPADEESGDEGYEGTDSPVLKVTPIAFPRTATFRCRIFSAFASEVLTEDATVNVISGIVPRVKVVANSGCGPGQFMITAFGSTDGDYRWYDNTGTLINGQVNSTFTTPLISASTIFSVGQSIGGCASEKVSVRVNIEDCASNPGLVWVAQPQEITTGSINITKITIDAGGNIYATGYFIGSVDFDTGPGTAILSTAGVGFTDREDFLLKLDKDRNVVWVKSLNKMNNLGSQISTDGSGNIYLAGYFSGTVDFDPGTPVVTMTATGNFDTFITKLDTDGNFIWAKRMGGTGTDRVMTRSVTSDANGVYITGDFEGTVDFDPNAGVQSRTSTNTSFSDIFISKLDPSGNFSWAHRMGGSFSEGGGSIKVDAIGNVYTTGTFQSSPVDFDPGAGSFTLTMSGGTDFYVHKLNNAGIFQWAVKVGGTQVELSKALALDASGNPHIIGTFGTTNSSNQIVDFDPGAGTFNLQSNQGLAFVLKLTAAGTFTLAKNFGWTFGIQPNDITIGVSGNILMTGYAEGSGFYNPDFDPGVGVYVLKTNINRDAFVTQLDASGNFSWAFNLGSTGRGFENTDGLSIVTDTDGSIYTAGSFLITSDFDPGHCTFPLFSSNGSSFIQKVKPGVASMCFNIQPVAVTNCIGTDATFSAVATGTTNITYQWQKLNTITSLYEDLTNTGGYSGTTTPDLVINTSGNFGAGSYQCKLKGDNAPDKVSIAAILITDQPPPTATGANACVSGPQTLIASGSTDGNYRWYSVATGGTAISGEVNATYTTPSLIATTIYYVSISNGNCESTRTAVTATINSTPSAPITTPTSVCSGSAATLNASGGSNGQYRWYTAPTGGSAITGEVNSTYITPVLVSTTTYYVSLFNGSCESTRTPVLATITVQPVKPVIASSIAPVGNALTICSTTALTLSAPNGFASYSWSTGAVTSQLTVTATGTYSVTVTDGSGCASPASDAVIITVVSAPCNNQAPVIASSTTSTIIGGQATINLLDLITDADDNIVLTSLVILQSPSSGALATIANGILDIDYKGINFSGRDQLTIQVCDVFGECTQQILEIEVIGDIEVYNGISPNNDNQNEIFLIRNIDLLPDTQNNKVTIYNRWGSKVFEVSDYNNTTNVFKGRNENGSELPSGTYFFKIEFKSGRTAETGYLSLKR